MKKYSEKHIAYLLKKSKKGNAPKKRKTLYNGKEKILYDKRGRKIFEKPKRIPVPVIFKLDNLNCEEAIKYINLLKDVSLKYFFIKIDLEKVIDIGEGAIALLLSLIKDLGMKNRIIGNYPLNSNAKDILEKSGFFKFMSEKGKRTLISRKNTILAKGVYDTPPDDMALEVRSAMKTVWGTEGRNPLLYGGIFEMIRNSCDHAFRNSSQVKWYLSITHIDYENKVKFSFVDNGKGILNTLSASPLKAVWNAFKGNSDILESAFKDGIESRTGLSWRGKGLPTIYELLEDKIVENLVVISNDIYIDFQNEIKINLKNEYSGTYYFWEVSKDCAKHCYN